MPATAAKDVGLIGHVVPDGSSAFQGRSELAAEIAASNGPLAVQAVLQVSAPRRSANPGQ